ncbi:MAG: hypothetical protein FJ405_11755, partial [Verrucomicrobia bacterium]|nr:hypothetical protein [Verrucomicrobiota bacterium]
AASAQLLFDEHPILEQLAQGSIRLPFGEIRKLAPPGFFSCPAAEDGRLVDLPLNEILPQVSPSAFARRNGQKIHVVPEEVTGLFTSKAKGSGTPPASRPVASAESAAKVASPATGGPAKPAQPAARTSQPASPSVAQNPPSARAPVPLRPTAAAPTPPPTPEPVPPVTKPIAAPSLLASMKPGAQSAASTGVPKPAPAPIKAALTSTGPALPANKAGSAGHAAVSARGPSPSAAGTQKPGVVPAATAATVNVPISVLRNGWPQPIQAEITARGITSLSVALPAAEVSEALKKGRVQFTWSALLSYVKDPKAKTSPAPSPHGGVLLDLPLPAVAPAFVAAMKMAAPRAVTVDPTIPDLFQSAVPGQVEAHSNSSPGEQTAGAPASGGSSLSIPLAMVDEAWPDWLRTAVAKARLAGPKLQLPVEEADRGLKSGKLEFAWKTLREWIVPPLPAGLAAEHGEKVVSLPLKVVAPLFLQQTRGERSNRKVEMGSEIPDLFTAGPPVPPAPAEATPPAFSVPAPPPVHGPKAEPAPINPSHGFSTTQFLKKRPADLGELFGQPGKTNWSPQEIVQNTSRIRGVDGAVVAMRDGLLVAAQLKAPWRPEATAAFLPQIHSRLADYMKELEAGDLQHVSLDTQSGTLHIYQVGIIYFAVVLTPGQEIAANLQAVAMVADELRRHSQ